METLYDFALTIFKTLFSLSQPTSYYFKVSSDIDKCECFHEHHPTLYCSAVDPDPYRQLGTDQSSKSNGQKKRTNGSLTATLSLSNSRVIFINLVKLLNIGTY